MCGPIKDIGTNEPRSLQSLSYLMNRHTFGNCHRNGHEVAIDQMSQNRVDVFTATERVVTRLDMRRLAGQLSVQNKGQLIWDYTGTVELSSGR